MSKPFDIILFGATGFTGQLIAKYISEHAEKEQIKWAIAGRDKEKLINVADSIKGNKPEIITADIQDDHSLKEMTSQAAVLMNAVGPFNWYGRNVVKACIETKTQAATRPITSSVSAGLRTSIVLPLDEATCSPAMKLR